MKFSLSDLPLEDFAMLGISSNDIHSFPKQTLHALLSGHRTSFIRFGQVAAKDGSRHQLDARLSIDKNKKGEIRLKIHPRRAQLKNRFGLTDVEQQYLKSHPGAHVAKTTPFSGEKELGIYVDPFTNEYIAVDKDKLIAPTAVNGMPLSLDDQKQFKRGDRLTVGKADVQMDPLSETGVAGNNINTLDFGRYNYSNKELFFDLSMLSIGAGPLVFLEHILRVSLLVANSQNNIHQVNHQQSLYKALTDAHEDISVLQRNLKKQGRAPSGKAIAEILEHRVGSLSPQKTSTATDGAATIPLVDEILKLDTALFLPEIRLAIAATQSQFKEFRQFDIPIPDQSAQKIVSHLLHNKGITVTPQQLSAGNLQGLFTNLSIQKDAQRQTRGFAS